MCSVLGSRVSALATSPAVTSWARCQCAVTRPSRHEGPSSPRGPATAEDARLCPPQRRSSPHERRRAESHCEDKEDDQNSQEEAQHFELVASPHPSRDLGDRAADHVSAAFADLDRRPSQLDPDAILTRGGPPP